MVSTAIEAGTQCFYAERDANGDYLDGGKTCNIALPGPAPVNQFRSFMVYDNHTRRCWKPISSQRELIVIARTS